MTFQTTITAAAGAENYVLHDKMSEGLEFNEIESVKIGENDVEKSNYEVNSSPTDGCSFDLTFTNEFCTDLNAGTQIVVTYTAVLTADAKVGRTNPNTNKTWLEYGDDNKTTSDEAKVYTYQFQLVKTDEGSLPAGTPEMVYQILEGAEFRLYDAETGGNEIQFVKEDEGVYRVATKEEQDKTVVIEAGSPILKGLDKKTYWLEETKAPKGFNKLTERVEVQITGDNLATGLGQEYKGSLGGVQVVNHAGTMLPFTGGMGTTIFYVLGICLIIGSAIVLVLRRRGSSEG